MNFLRHGARIAEWRLGVDAPRNALIPHGHRTHNECAALYRGSAPDCPLEKREVVRGGRLGGRRDGPDGFVHRGVSQGLPVRGHAPVIAICVRVTHAVHGAAYVDRCQRARAQVLRRRAERRARPRRAPSRARPSPSRAWRGRRRTPATRW